MKASCITNFIITFAYPHQNFILLQSFQDFFVYFILELI